MWVGREEGTKEEEREQSGAGGGGEKGEKKEKERKEVFLWGSVRFLASAVTT